MNPEGKRSSGGLLGNERHVVTENLLSRAVGALAQRLPLRTSVLRRLSSRWLKDNIDDTRLERLATPLHLAKPREVIEQLESCGGVQFLLSEQAETAFNSCIAVHQVNEVLAQASKAVTATLKAHRLGELAVSLTVVARGLATISMSSFVPGSDCLRGDLATILSSDPGNRVGLITRYKRATLSGDAGTVEAVDQRIVNDPIWGCWVDIFLREGGEIARSQKPTTHWEFTGPPMTRNNANGIRRWLFRR